MAWRWKPPSPAARPPLYSVLLLNDDYTPMDFVVEVLVRFFAMDIERATQVMLHVHTRDGAASAACTPAGWPSPRSRR